MWHVWRRGEVHKAFGGGNLREKAHLEDGKTLLKWISKK
jgi:hypothetical protein